ncbi:hypothetical protein NLC29_00065 [Candidatus Aminicenantes bacterium AH-873-B07]|nr:hypothetical protein [Candidatus Aminicenantes bacterium AH-873-B07]
MSIIDEIKSIAKTIQQIDNISLYQKILNLQADIMELLEQNNKLKEENKDLKEKLKIKDSLKFENDVYWTVDKQGKIKDGPFCSRCWDVKNLLVHLLFCPNPLYSKCPECQQVIKVQR